MKIIEITAGDQHGFNHPREAYANFKPSVSLKAIVEDGEDADTAARELLARAHKLVLAERERIEAEIDREFLIENDERLLRDIPGCIKYQQDEIRALEERKWPNDAEQITRHQRAIAIFEAKRPVLEQRIALLRSGADVSTLPEIPNEAPF